MKTRFWCKSLGFGRDNYRAAGEGKIKRRANIIHHLYFEIAVVKYIEAVVKLPHNIFFLEVSFKLIQKVSHPIALNAEEVIRS